MYAMWFDCLSYSIFDLSPYCYHIQNMALFKDMLYACICTLRDKPYEIAENNEIQYLCLNWISIHFIHT